jgi:hypothetical protein
MHGLTTEYRRSGVVISKDLATHMALRQHAGTIAVVTDHPLALLSAVRKQWLRLISKAQRENASTLNRQRKDGLDHAIVRMQEISFAAYDPADDPVSYISFATSRRFALFPPICTTLYIIEPLEKIELHMITSWMPPGGLVVIYDEPR